MDRPKQAPLSLDETPLALSERRAAGRGTYTPQQIALPTVGAATATPPKKTPKRGDRVLFMHLWMPGARQYYNLPVEDVIASMPWHGLHRWLVKLEGEEMPCWVAESLTRTWGDDIWTHLDHDSAIYDRTPTLKGNNPHIIPESVTLAVSKP